MAAGVGSVGAVVDWPSVAELVRVCGVVVRGVRVEELVREGLVDDALGSLVVSVDVVGVVAAVLVLPDDVGSLVLSSDDVEMLALGVSVCVTTTVAGFVGVLLRELRGPARKSQAAPPRRARVSSAATIQQIGRAHV